MRPTTIDGVLLELDRQVAVARAARSPLGYFPALYRRVTRRIQVGIAQREFEDNERMERMDVIFANRYLDACADREGGRETTDAWKVSFKAANTWSPIVLQHLLLGMNAHINLDLGVAAVQAAPGQALPSFEKDFNQINAILGSLLESVKSDLEAIWPLLGTLDHAIGSTEDVIANFSMARARGEAWAFAERLAQLPADQHPAAIARRDAQVATFGRCLWRPGWLIQAPMLLLRVSEGGTVQTKIDHLAS
ncbi:MAG: DUF5995 family protein [Pseudomonadota bacterium]|nr:DUF5995 family protein [Pseudomonadota bacterium]